MEEVSYFYKDLYQHWTTKPDYNKMINALGPGSFKILSKVKLLKTESQILVIIHNEPHEDQIRKKPFIFIRVGEGYYKKRFLILCTQRQNKICSISFDVYFYIL